MPYVPADAAVNWLVLAGQAILQDQCAHAEAIMTGLSIYWNLLQLWLSASI